jgi:putative peptidoglycan lipid II flippase
MGGDKKTTLERRIFKAGFFVLIAHLLFKLAGLIQAKVMGYYLPQATYDVVYAVAFENCIFMIFLIGEEIIGPAMLPVFMRELDTESEESAWSLANTVLTIQFILLAVVSAFLMFFPHTVAAFLTQWSPTNSPEKFELAAKSIRTLAPAVIGLSLGSTTYVLLNSYKRFFLAAFGNAVWKFCVVAFLIIGACLSKDSAATLMWGLIAGSLCKLATHLFGLRDKLPRFRPCLALNHPAFKRLCWLALPLIAGVIVAKIRDEVNNVYLLSALDRSGLMQANSMGRKLQATFLFLVPYTLSVAAFPFFCELVDKNELKKLGELLTKFGRMLLAFFIPMSLLIAVGAVPLTALIFKGGHFDSVAVQRTAVSLSFYTCVLPAAAIEALLMQAFFANRRMVAVTVLGIVFSGLSILISWLGLCYFSGHDLILLACIAGGFTLSRYLKCFALVRLFQKNAPVFPFGETMLFLVRAGVAAGFASAAGIGVLRLLRHQSNLVQFGAIAVAFMLVFVVAAYFFRISEIRDFFELATNKLHAKKKAAN